MKRYPLLPALIALAVVAAACGDDTVDPGSSGSTLPDVPATDVPATDVPVTDVPGESSDPPVTYDHPTGADDVVFEYAELGGFLPREYAFQATPSILVSGDGRVFTPGPQVAIYPGPLLPNIQVRTLTEAGVQQLLAAADRAGLFADVDYEFDGSVAVADAPTATVTINVGGATWVHEAYALGILGEDGAMPPARQALADFLDELQFGGLIDEGEYGESVAFEPDGYLIEAAVIDDLAAVSSDLEPTVVDWPAAASVRLADAESCVAVPASEVGAALLAANQLTFFEDDGVIYQVFAKPVLPGTACER